MRNRLKRQILYVGILKRIPTEREMFYAFIKSNIVICICNRSVLLSPIHLKLCVNMEKLSQPK